MASTLHHGVLERIGAAIITGTYPPGHVLTLERLCSEQAVSRTVAREVVQVLQSMGLVASRRRTGVTVLPRSGWNVFDPSVIRWRLAGPERTSQLRQLTELRAAIEPPAAASAAVHASPSRRARLGELAALLEDAGAAGDLDTFLDHDVEFHTVVLQASGNDMFAGLTEVVEAVLRGRTRHHLMPAHPKPEARRLHSVVADAVAGGEPEVAQAAMTAIVAEVVAEVARMGR
ncbi:MAG: FCD domain-containing protein [Actinomycetota bacterium]|nr:FCD domain-containing protein [Actinomycetota bacterium]